MKKLFFLSLVTLLILSCNSDEKEETGGNADTKELFEQNLAVVKSMIASFEKKDMDAFFANVADTVTWSSPVYGDTVETKAHYRESLQYWQDNWDSLHLVGNPNFLQGVDPVTNIPDGSVRYYGQWDGVHKATGKTTHVQLYEYFNFNADHKVISNGQYFDVGGLMNSLK